MKLALCQFGVTAPSGIVDFIARIDAIAASARSNGADMLVLPEYAAMVLAGAFVKSPDIAAELATVVARAETLVTALRAIAKTQNIFLLGGSLPMRDADGRIRNRAPFIAASGALAFQDKRSMTRFEAEKWGIAGGAGPQVFATPFGKIGVSICYDAEFPLHVRAQVTAGAELILVPSCTDTHAGFNRVRLCARARAIENQCFVAVVPLVGTASWSGAIDENHGYAALFGPADKFFPDSGVLARGVMDSDALVFADVDFGRCGNVRRDGGVLNHRDWPEAIAPCPVTSLS